MKNKDQKVNFNNVAIAFASKSKADLIRSYLLFSTFHYTVLISIANKLIQVLLKIIPWFKSIIKATIYVQFCGGETAEDCLPVAKKLKDYGVNTILDYSVEGEDDERVISETFEALKKAIQIAIKKSEIPFAVFKITGLGDTKVLHFNSKDAIQDPALLKKWDNMSKNVMRLAKIAADGKTKLLIDAEESWFQDGIDTLALEAIAQHNHFQPIIYNTYQLYRLDALDKFKKDVAWAKSNGLILGAKLVRGAYMEKEREAAKIAGTPSPIHPNKAHTDQAFNEALLYGLDHLDHVGLCVGTHNEASNLLLIEEMTRRNIPKDHDHIWFAQLYGMSDHITYNLAKAGYLVVKYLPYGPVPRLLPYLFRRALENSSVKGQSSRELMLIKQELKRRRQSL